jgi:hypothetical protein
LGKQNVSGYNFIFVGRKNGVNTRGVIGSCIQAERETVLPGKFILAESVSQSQENKLDLPTFILPTMAIPGFCGADCALLCLWHSGQFFKVESFCR